MLGTAANVPAAIVSKEAVTKARTELSAADLKLYGQSRFPKGYKKVRILGKGGCAVVYLAKRIDDGQMFAIK